MNLTPLITLAHRRWNIPIVAALYAHSGAKFVTLANQLGVSRGSLSTSLRDLIELGIVIKNPGHGHPMRPEYLLTEKGKAIGAHCLALVKLVRRSGDADVAFRKWTLPLVVAIGSEVVRFNQVRSALSLATPRAITLSLKSLVQSQWIARNLIDDYPPTAGYALRAKGQRVLACVGGLTAI